MKNKRNVLYSLIIVMAVVISFPAQCQYINGYRDAVGTEGTHTSYGPNGIVRTVKQDSKGNIWIASWEGVFKYDGKSFTTITAKVSQARFFSVLEDNKGNFWFASVGSGVYYYDGKSFQNFTTEDGLANNRVTVIYEDKTGTIWFGSEGGASRYDGKSFKNFKMNETHPVAASDSVHVSFYQNLIPQDHWSHNDVNAIIEDKAGKFWFATRGYATIYDGKTFTTLTNKDGKPFTNVRCIIKDKKGNIWLGGAEGLWRYDGKTFVNFTSNFVGYVYEDKKGNIWTSSESAEDKSWALSRYDEKSLLDKNPALTIVKANEEMIFGILEDDKGNIWFGSMNGVYRYDGNTIIDFKEKGGRK